MKVGRVHACDEVVLLRRTNGPNHFLGVHMARIIARGTAFWPAMAVF